VNRGSGEAVLVGDGVSVYRQVYRKLRASIPAIYDRFAVGVHARWAGFRAVILNPANVLLHLGHSIVEAMLDLIFGAAREVQRVGAI
jgi:hypothetical protein